MAMIRMNDAELHQRLKVAAATVGCSVEAYVAEAVRLRLDPRAQRLDLHAGKPIKGFSGPIPKTVSARKSKGK